MRLGQDPRYTRLPGGGRLALGPVQFWLAADHLLLVEVVWLVEKYRRFDLRQIAALTVRPTTFRFGRIALAAVPTCVLGAVAWAALTANVAPNADRGATLVVGGVSAGAALVLSGYVVRLLLQGRSYEVRLTTSLQTHVLPGFHTRAQAERFVAALVTAARRVQDAEFGGAPEPPPTTAPDSAPSEPAAAALTPPAT